jgi:Predicted alternative tryptophan synthase beta-subunit (paralog of TrpB)
MVQPPRRHGQQAAPLINPGTGQPVTFDDLKPVFCDELIKQELDNDTAYIPIPDDIRAFYKMYRPSPWSGPTAWRRS